MKILALTRLLFITLPLVGCGSNPTEVKLPASPQNVTTEQTTQWGFDGDAVDSLPAGVESFSGKWVVRAETDAPSPPNALCQIETTEFPALSLSTRVYTDVVVSTRFKPISGTMDQAAGIIFRIQDQDNYYILRANALENNVNIYKYAGGQRSGIKDGSAQVVSGQWQELRVEVTGNLIRGFLNDQLVVEATDDTYPAGRIGLWTKVDSVTCFDDIQANLP